MSEGGEEERETGLSGGLRERPKKKPQNTLLVAFLVTMQKYPLDTHESEEGFVHSWFRVQS